MRARQAKKPGGKQQNLVLETNMLSWLDARVPVLWVPKPNRVFLGKRRRRRTVPYLQPAEYVVSAVSCSIQAQTLRQVRKLTRRAFIPRKKYFMRFFCFSCEEAFRGRYAHACTRTLLYLDIEHACFIGHVTSPGCLFGKCSPEKFDTR